MCAHIFHDFWIDFTPEQRKNMSTLETTKEWMARATQRFSMLQIAIIWSRWCVFLLCVINTMVVPSKFSLFSVAEEQRLKQLHSRCRDMQAHIRWMQNIWLPTVSQKSLAVLKIPTWGHGLFFNQFCILYSLREGWTITNSMIAFCLEFG